MGAVGEVKMESIAGILDSLARVIDVGGKGAVPAVVTFIIVLSLLGYLLFRSDRSAYKSMVFVFVGAVSVFVTYALLVGAEDGSQVPPKPISDVDPDAAAVASVGKVRTYVLNAVYGPNVYFGMSEAELRSAVLGLPKGMRIRNFDKVGSFTIGKSFETITWDRNGGLDVRYGFFDDKLAYVKSWYTCTYGSGKDCTQICDAALDEMEKAFSVDGVYPPWGPYIEDDLQNDDQNESLGITKIDRYRTAELQKAPFTYVAREGYTHFSNKYSITSYDQRTCYGLSYIVSELVFQ